MTVDEKIEKIMETPDLNAAVAELDREINELRVHVYRADGEFLQQVERFVQHKDVEVDDLFKQDFHATWVRNGYAARQTCDALMRARTLLIRAKFKTKLAIRRQFPRPESRPLDNSELRRIAVERGEHPATYIPEEN